jgi:hypothetical protein
MSKITYELLREELELGLTQAAIAAKYDMNVRSVERRVANLKRTGYDPANNRTHKNPIDQPVKGYSTLHRLKSKDDESTGVVLEWVKTTNDKFTESILEIIREETNPIEIKDIPKCKSKKQDTDVIPWFNIGDGHFGMIAYDKEVGHNFDLSIAERELCFAMGRSIELAAGHERCVIQDMGDMTHYETFAAQTEASGHNLDYDTRYPKMIRTYRRTMEYIVTKALKHFKYVDVIINQGNHSRSNDIWMAEHLRALFKKTERVNVLNNECVFIPYRMGNTFVMCHHTDKCKGQKLVDVMMTDFRQDFGEARYKYIDGGHIHTRKATEQGDVVTETFNQLAPADKYAHDAGWRSRSCLTTVFRSKTYGEKGRKTLTAEEVKDQILGCEAGQHVNSRREVHTV